jgi:hypothetical protein
MLAHDDRVDRAGDRGIYSINQAAYKIEAAIQDVLGASRGLTEKLIELHQQIQQFLKDVKRICDCTRKPMSLPWLYGCRAHMYLDPGNDVIKAEYTLCRAQTILNYLCSIKGQKFIRASYR